MSNGGDGGGGDSGNGGGGAESGAGAVDSPSWFAGVGGAVGLGVDGFNSLASMDADAAGGDQQTGADATATESTEGSEGSGEGEEEDTSASDGQDYEGSDTEGSDDSEGSEEENTSTSEGQDDGGPDTEGSDNSEDSEGEGTEGDSDSEGNTQNTESTAESNPAGAPPPDSSIMQESKRRGGGPGASENDDDSKKCEGCVDKKLDEQQARSQKKDAESTDDAQKAEAKRREQPVGDDIGQPEKSRVSAEQTSKKALFGQQEGQDIQDNSPVRRPDSRRGRGTILGVRPEDLWKHKGSSAAPRGDFLPKGGGSRYSDGKQPIGASDKISTEMERLKAHTEAVSSWNSEAVGKYKERLLKDPGTAGELARKYHRLEHPGVG